MRVQRTSDGKFGSFYRLGHLSLVQQNEQIFFQVISFMSFFLAKHNSNGTCYLSHLLLCEFLSWCVTVIIQDYTVSYKK